ncbi:G-protein coupled receptor family C group 6 member A isoform X2 [Brachyhypopomus gauderio]|uniref:G-protein coupled receptor family C group 6 member A isoform X2 n=1 Tax=Brachyhypopomus gauderio TaxID=698409 RepID=UPI004041A553
MCSFSQSGLTQSLAMIHAVEKVNNSPLLKHVGVTLGYNIRDTCSDVTTALRDTADFIKKHLDCLATPSSLLYTQPMMAVIGAYSSEMTIAVARELNLELIPQISYASTADILSDKSRFPAFSRTVPSDVHQTNAMVKLLLANSWNWVGVVTTDGDYGRSAMDSFVSQALEVGICVAFKEVLPDSVTNKKKLHSAISHAIQTIHTNSKVKVVVSFAKPEHMSSLFRGLVQHQEAQHVWVASDNWSTFGDVLRHEDLYHIGWVVGFSFKSRDVTPFKEYLRSLDENSEENNSFLEEFYSRFRDSHNTSDVNVSALTDQLIRTTPSGVVYSIELAVNAIAQAVAKLCSNRNCSDPEAIEPWELLPNLRNSTFQMDGESYTFDENGDVNLGYDVTLWEMAEGRLKTLNVVAEYHLVNKSLTITSLGLNITSRCSDSCEPGQFKKTTEGHHTCCYECSDCAENQYSNSTDMDQCYACDSSTEWAEPGSSMCMPKTLDYFPWSDGFAVVLLSLAGIGVLVVGLVSFLFFWYRESPVVKAAGGPLCHLILLSLLGSFVSVTFFVGKPTDTHCKVRQVLYGMSFTLCVSCILVKSLNILLAFQMKLLLQQVLRRLYKSYVVVCVCTALQGVICTSWLLLKSPHKTFTLYTKFILEECDEGSNEAFAVMLGYIALLALLCFIIAFQGRKLPEKYNEAKFITFGMLVYLMAWVIFIPIYINTDGKYLPAVEMVVILISNYGILSCHFLPKCYNIIFRKTYNTRDAFMKNIYEYSTKCTYNVGDMIQPEIQKCAGHSYYSTTSPPYITTIPAAETKLDTRPKLAYQNYTKTTTPQSQLELIRKRALSI